MKRLVVLIVLAGLLIPSSFIIASDTDVNTSKTTLDDVIADPSTYINDLSDRTTQSIEDSKKAISDVQDKINETITLMQRLSDLFKKILDFFAGFSKLTNQ